MAVGRVEEVKKVVDRTRLPKINSLRMWSANFLVDLLEDYLSQETQCLWTPMRTVASISDVFRPEWEKLTRNFNNFHLGQSAIQNGIPPVSVL